MAVVPSLRREIRMAKLWIWIATVAVGIVGLLTTLVVWRLYHPVDPCAEMIRGLDEMIESSGGTRVAGGWSFSETSNGVPRSD